MAKICIQLFQLRSSQRQGKRSNTSAKGLSGKTSFIPEYITAHRFSTKFKIKSYFFYEYKSQLRIPNKGRLSPFPVTNTPACILPAFSKK